ncbi:MAG: hypothetical protein Q4B69_07855 [Slackia sp.]|nr:hypothetical protein [Slackia sp.]
MKSCQQSATKDQVGNDRDITIPSKGDEFARFSAGKRKNRAKPAAFHENSEARPRIARNSSGESDTKAPAARPHSDAQTDASTLRARIRMQETKRIAA